MPSLEHAAPNEPDACAVDNTADGHALAEASYLAAFDHKGVPDHTVHLGLAPFPVPFLAPSFWPTRWDRYTDQTHLLYWLRFHVYRSSIDSICFNKLT
ncbi:hypothetical protein JCM19237_5503 [Photobacterium aphoticum]|uniref:Uncharacterized protein n=1 Tax=Photobacterium aphoticum TaxID=754436 RepID=A0A090QHJ5_9GAMM|nr:hypothetical protein JCM19237_5503 [Photobacterium aphoticum]